MNKKGISMVSMLIYVILFFGFATFAVSMSTSMNYKTLTEKGNIINNENFQKLQYNLINSAKKSSKIDTVVDKIVFSNNDSYRFDVDKKIIYKNDGILVEDVESFKIININEITNKPKGLEFNIDKTKDNICIDVTFSKYNNKLNRKIFTVVGDEINE